MRIRSYPEDWQTSPHLVAGHFMPNSSDSNLLTRGNCRFSGDSYPRGSVLLHQASSARAKRLTFFGISIHAEAVDLRGKLKTSEERAAPRFPRGEIDRLFPKKRERGDMRRGAVIFER